MNNRRQFTYQHTFHSESPYENGKQLAEHVKVLFESPQLILKQDVSENKSTWLASLVEQLSLDLWQEIQGIADTLDICPKKLFYQLEHIGINPGCTQIASKFEGQCYLARSYDFSDTIYDFRLATNHYKDSYRSIGFACSIYGRLDGMNEHGLAISMAAAGMPGAQSSHEGIHFWTLIRVLLDRCSTVNEARELIRDVPSIAVVNLMLVDASGDMLCVELDGASKEFREPKPNEDYLCATNHFIKKIRPNSSVFKNSTVRYNQAIQLLQKVRHIDELKEFFELSYPMGACCRDFDNFFGSLHAVIYDTVNTNVHISFGPPHTEGWTQLGLDVPTTKLYQRDVVQEALPHTFFLQEKMEN